MASIARNSVSLRISREHITDATTLLQKTSTRKLYVWSTITSSSGEMDPKGTRNKRSTLAVRESGPCSPCPCWESCHPNPVFSKLPLLDDALQTVRPPRAELLSIEATARHLDVGGVSQQAGEQAMIATGASRITPSRPRSLRLVLRVPEPTRPPNGSKLEPTLAPSGPDLHRHLGIEHVRLPTQRREGLRWPGGPRR